MSGEQQVDSSLIDEWAWSDAHALPGAVDVAVIGGGIVGCSAAYFLAREGLRVAVFEKGRIAGEQSGRNWGWVRQQGRSPVELPLMMRSLQLWLELREELGDIGFRQGGSLYLAEDDAQLAELEEWLSVAREHRLDTRLLDAQELAAVLRTDDRRWSGALHTASDARAEPSRATPAIARAAQRRGAQIFSHCAVRGDRSRGWPPSGCDYRARARRGIDGRLRRRCLDEQLLPIDRHHLPAIDRRRHSRAHRSDPRDPRWRSLVSCHRDPPSSGRRLHGRAWRLIPPFIDPQHAAARPQVLAGLPPGSRFNPGSPRLGRSSRRCALLRAGQWMRFRPSNASGCCTRSLKSRSSSQMRAALERCFPEIAPAAFVETWGGMIEASPDVLPVISHVDGHEGFLVASGFSGHGFGIGPGAGKLIADMVRGVADRDEVRAFRLQRFFDGSPIRPGPSI